MKRRTFLASVPLAAAGLALDGGALAAPRPKAKAQPKPAPEIVPGSGTIDRPDVHGGDRPTGASWASRSAAFGLSGAAGTAHPLATLAGIDILKAGGSAVDAAIAINACLGFLEPTACGIGGDAYAMLWDPKLGKVVGIAGSGRSPRNLSLETVRSRARADGTIPSHGAVSVSVPGAVDCWWTLHQRYGKLKWADLFEPAIAHAEHGAPVAPVVAEYLYRGVKAIKRTDRGVEENANAIATYAPGGEAPRPGEIFRNPDLARTYRMIAKGGRDAFYEGEIARTIDAYFKRIGGWMDRADLAAHRSNWSEPFATDYRGTTVHAIGENTQGLATLQMLNMLERFDMKAAGFQSARSIHLQAEAKRLAYEDRARHYADPAAVRVPEQWLVSKAYAAERAKLIRPDRINRSVRPGNAPSHGDTTYFTVADRDGMMVSFIQSNFRGMGSGLVADGLGFMFQDRGQLFALEDGHPNIYAPGKRPFQTIIPGFATRGGQPWMSFGVMGGDMQPQGQVQIIVNTVDHGLDIQAAGDSPRWHHEGSSERMGEDTEDSDGPIGLLRLERGVPDATRKALANMGWKLGESDGGFGRYQCIEARSSGGRRVYAGASEMRADGVALAY
ncbi:gamma-glutamyltransferase family protein [Allosphingosinicella indica]|uniref:Gamma-glutamyltranspeptidase / glutathione hydrolase n=1 Tax=Allosphingosinicella indica TaxID=941907 RepID=A0A1X7G9T9_9SPHN|nr:gamma-glutamyltransferase family protein [Allosphingosinicella indica]SMF65986.1 gamma-glutamyltranspeptidase / glutathione hydrolase [Allosphingosinicella indica]